VRPSDADWRALQHAVAGEVILPNSPGYESARKPAIANFHDVRPAAVLRCRTATDVGEGLRFAARTGLATAARSGGHCFAGRSSTAGLVIDVAPLRSLTVAGELATVGAGTQLGALYDALAEHGVTLPAGCGDDVGIAGLTLGGGLGLLGRQYGLTCDRLVSAQVVLADGRVVECGEHHHEDLLWALRGAGGGRFGVVTSLRLRTVALPADATSLHVEWPYAAAAAVIAAWQAWAPDGPDALAASLLVTAAGGLDRPPRVDLLGAMFGARSDAAEQLDELVARVGVEPAAATLAPGSLADVKRALGDATDAEDAGDAPQEPGHVHHRSEFFARPLPRDAIAALVEGFTAGRAAGESRTLDFTPWGGAYNRVPAGATAFVHRAARFLLKHEVVLDRGAGPGGGWPARSWATVHPWGTGGVYPNFPEPARDAWDAAYHGANREWLQRVQAAYDPDGAFRLSGGAGAGGDPEAGA